jgi:ribosome-binding protein aMBF1 (putative translation factor)
MQVSNLRSYLAETGISIKQLSEMINYNAEYLRQIARGSVSPSHRLARDIFNVTGGVVKLQAKTKKPKENQTEHN